MAKHIRTPHDVVLQAWFTERTNDLMEQEGRYAFKVDARSNKYQIRSAIEKIFKVEVANVNVMSVRGKTRRVRAAAGRTASWKKAIVRLKPGFTIEY